MRPRRTPAPSGPSSSPRRRPSSASPRSNSSPASSSPRSRPSSTAPGTANHDCARSSPRTGPTSSSRTTSCSSRRWPPRAFRSSGSCRAARWRFPVPTYRPPSRGCRAAIPRNGVPTVRNSRGRCGRCGPTSTPGYGSRAPRACQTWSSCRATTRPTCTSIRPKPITWICARWVTPGHAWTPASAKPTRPTRCLARWPTGRPTVH